MMISLRLGRRSTQAPAKSENISRGKNWHTPKSPRRNGELVSEYTSQYCAVRCIKVPMREMHCPVQKYLKFRLCREWNVLLK